MKSELTIITSLVCLTILGVVAFVTQPADSKVLYAIVAAVGAIAGVGGTIAVRSLALHTDRERILLHMPHGLLFVLFGYIAWWLAIGWIALLVIYEVNEDGHLTDNAWKDIKGMLWGVGIGGAIYAILILGGII